MLLELTTAEAYETWQALTARARQTGFGTVEHRTCVELANRIADLHAAEAELTPPEPTEVQEGIVLDLTERGNPK